MYCMMCNIMIIYYYACTYYVYSFTEVSEYVTLCVFGCLCVCVIVIHSILCTWSYAL